MIKPTSDNKKAIRLLTISSILCEYAARMLVDQSKQELKLRLNGVINSAKSVQKWFLYHPQINQEQKAIIESDIYDGDIIVLGEIIDLLYGIKEQDLEVILNELKNYIDDDPKNKEGS